MINVIFREIFAAIGLAACMLGFIYWKWVL